jgi:acyl-CoA synthetase (NDP forming)
VADDFELLDASKALAHIGQINGDRIAIVGSAGGFGVIATDYVASKSKGFGLSLASIGEPTKAKLREKVPSFASVDNPIDLTESTDQMYHEVIELMQGEESLDAISQPALPATGHDGRCGGCCRVGEKGWKPMVVCCVGEPSPAYPPSVGGEGRAHLWTSRRAVFALRCLYERGRYLRRVQEEGSI